MGVTHGNKKTYPRLGDVIGFITPEDGKKVAESIMLVQRDHGNRQDRKNAVSHTLLPSPGPVLILLCAASEVHCRPTWSPQIQGFRRGAMGQEVCSRPSLPFRF